MFAIVLLFHYFFIVCVLSLFVTMTSHECLRHISTLIRMTHSNICFVSSSTPSLEKSTHALYLWENRPSGYRLHRSSLAFICMSWKQNVFRVWWERYG